MSRRNLALRRLLAFLVDHGVMVLFVAVLSVAGFAIRSLLGVNLEQRHVCGAFSKNGQLYVHR